MITYIYFRLKGTLSVFSINDYYDHEEVLDLIEDYGVKPESPVMMTYKATNKGETNV